MKLKELMIKTKSKKKKKKIDIYKMILNKIDDNGKLTIENEDDLLSLLKYFENTVQSKKTIIGYASNFLETKKDCALFKTAIKITKKEIIATNGAMCCIAKNTTDLEPGLYDKSGLTKLDPDDINYPDFSSDNEMIHENLLLFKEDVNSKNYFDDININKDDLLSLPLVTDYFYNHAFVKSILSYDGNFNLYIHDKIVLIFKNENVQIALMPIKI